MGKRGQKVCKSCDQINGARAYTCKKCGEPFKMKNGAIRYGKKPIEDWTTLKEGDCFRVLSRSGDYYYNKNGDKVHFTTAGKYRVKEIHDEGIACWGMGGKTSGYYYLYMGEEKQTESGSMCWKSPHRIVRIKDPLSRI